MEIPRPAPDEVLVQVRACGLCGTDLHLALEGTLTVDHTPITLGHEAAGVIAETGRNVSTVKEGDRIAIFPAISCGRCRYCAIGRESLCDASRIYGMDRDGALAEYIVIKDRSAIPMPDEIPFDVGAITTDSVATPFHALRTRGALRAGETVAVIGVGGLGSHAIQLARLMGASRVIAVDVNERVLARSRRLGADLAINPTETDPAPRIRKDLDIDGVDLALEFVGLPETVETAIRCLKKGGRAVIVGIGPARPTLPPLALFVGREQAVLGSFGMDRRDIEDLFTLIRTDRLELSDSITARYPLSLANQALQHLASKERDVVRVVVEPTSARQ
jgi:propanol-preferring alcohol dehydrogenase